MQQFEINTPDYSLKVSRACQPIPGELQAEASSLPFSQWTESQPGHPEVHPESEGSSSAPAVGETAEGAGGGLPVGAEDPGWGWPWGELGKTQKRSWMLGVAPNGPLLHRTLLKPPCRTALNFSPAQALLPHDHTQCM